MKPLPPTLTQLQHWLQAAISHPAGVQAGIISAEAQEAIAVSVGDVERVVQAGPQLSSIEQLAIYQHAYFARLLGALREFFPCLSATLGDELFAQFGLAYLQRHPSRSYTLHALADHFIAFLRDTQPADAPWAGFWIDLARLEQAIDRVFDAPGPEQTSPLSLDDLACVDAESWPTTRMGLAIGFELLALNYPVGEFYTEWKQGQQPKVPQASDAYCALLRRDFVVRRHELSVPQFRLLGALALGESVGEAIEAAAGCVSDLDEFASQLQGWFAHWAREGFFASLRLDEGGTAV